MSSSPRSIAAAVAAVLASLLLAAPAWAVTPMNGFQCLNAMTGTLTVTPSNASSGQTVTVTWHVYTPDKQTCPGLFTQQVDGVFKPASGSKTVQVSQTSTFQLKGYYGVPNRQLDTATVIVPEPAAQLVGSYRGTITSDFDTTTGIGADVTGEPQNLAATITLTAGAAADCQGRQNLDTKVLTLTGHRTEVVPDGSSSFFLAGEFAFNVDTPLGKVHVVVDVTLDGATLSTDGQTFAGTAAVVIRPDGYSNCVTSWPFTMQRITPVTVPPVRDQSRAEATATLTAVGLQTAVTFDIDRGCGTLPGRVMAQQPAAGALVAPNSTVTITLAVRPSACP